MSPPAIEAVAVVLFTTEEPRYLPRSLAPILDAYGDEVVETVLVPPAGGTVAEARRYLRAFGPSASLRLGARLLGGALLDGLPFGLGRRLTGRHHGVASLAAAHGVPVRRVTDVGAPPLAEHLRDLDPVLLLSVVCARRLPPRLLDVPDLAVNLHGSLLPKYRGRATAFWPLYYGDEETGVTAHLMTDTLDAGPILAQRALPFREGDALDDVARSIADAGGDLAVDLLDRLLASDVEGPGDLETRPNRTTPADYHTLPTPGERREFRRRGNAFL